MDPDTPAGTAHEPRRGGRLVPTALGLALFTAGMWFAWLGWDHEYHQVDGETQGPYRAWQVIGCGASIAVAAVVAHLRLRGTVAVVVLAAAATAGFATPWSLDASATDDSGLWVVGLVFLLVGVGGGLGVLLGFTEAVARGRRPSPRSTGWAQRGGG